MRIANLDAFLKLAWNLDVYHHWKKDNITSLIEPCIYNNERVGWIGVRYGKDRKEVDILNAGAHKDDVYGFQKHACLQYCITQEGFEINLFHAVKYDAVDRDHLHGKIDSLENEIIKEIKKLRGEGIYWCINDSLNANFYSFYFDNEDPSDFIEYYREYDSPGRESYAAYHFTPDDPNLQSLEGIGDLIIEKFRKLLPLYNLVTFRIPH